MKLHRLQVSNFAAVREVDIEFGPGLNVLYGPNDLGKSTLVEAIRLALLLPHASTSCEPFVRWTGGRDPVVDLTFETEPQRIWRVRKEFGKGGSSLLQESRNGLDYPFPDNPEQRLLGVATIQLGLGQRDRHIDQIDNQIRIHFLTSSMCTPFG